MTNVADRNPGAGARRSGWTAVWLVLLFGVQVTVLATLWHYAVRTTTGQLLDTIALTGASIGRRRIEEPVGAVLNAVSVLSLLAATVTIGFIALLRRRIALAVMATGLIAGANVTTQLLKHGLPRPDLGVDPDRVAVGNTLPSGHATVAASVAVALVLVLPPRIRGWAAALAAGYAALAGVATLSAGWHRPSDAAASMLVVGAWAALAGLGLWAAQRPDTRVDRRDGHGKLAVLLVLAGWGLLAAGAVAFDWTREVLTVPPEQLHRTDLFVAYAGGAAGIAGTAAVVVGLVLTSLHRVVPPLRPAAPPDPDAGTQDLDAGTQDTSVEPTGEEPADDTTASRR